MDEEPYIIAELMAQDEQRRREQRKKSPQSSDGMLYGESIIEKKSGLWLFK